MCKALGSVTVPQNKMRQNRNRKTNVIAQNHTNLMTSQPCRTLFVLVFYQEFSDFTDSNSPIIILKSSFGRGKSDNQNLRNIIFLCDLAMSYDFDSKAGPS